MAVALPSTSNDLSWDDEIVPALKRRLESESIMLSKRMSANSFSSIEESPAHYHKPGSNSVASSSTSTSTYTPSFSSNRSTRPYQVSPHKSRSRTKSQPFPFDPSASARAGSPPAMPTRIPVLGRGTTPLPASPPTQDWSVLHEPAPFSPPSSHSHEPYDPVTSVSPEPIRQSFESEERPFEHWYRGEVARNGGVGELRVGSRKEMLEIANYGHRAREQAKRKRAESVTGTPVSKTRLVARESFYMDEEEDQVGPSVLDEGPLTDLDNDEETDKESVHRAGVVNGYHEEHDDEDTSPEPDPDSRLSGRRSTTPTPARMLIRQHTEPPSTPHRPSPTSHSASSSMATPLPNGKASVTVTSPKSARITSPRQPTKPSKSHSQPLLPTSKNNKRTATSPSTPLPKKKNPTSRRPPPRKDVDTRRSVAEYPHLGGGEDTTLMDAIPTWTQPTAKTGNWDEVVIPVVARKRGLEDHYEEGDGTPQPPRVQPMVVEPAPGTFGYDPSRWLRWHGDKPVNGVEMDEFSPPPQPIKELPEPEPKPEPKPEPEPTVDLTEGPEREDEHEDDIQPEEQEEKTPEPPKSPVHQKQPAPLPRMSVHDNKYINGRPSSPKPFSRYIPTAEEEIEPQPQPPREQRPEVEVQEEPSGGCCKCIIM